MILPHLAVRALSASVQCPVVLDGRISQNFTLENFDTNASPYNPGFTKGSDPWSKIILFPAVPTPSRFDAAASANATGGSGFKPLEVTINDRSIFNPPPGKNPQLGFRRAGLLLGNGSDASNQGVMTFHWSAMQDSARKLNLTHEYLTSFHETNDSGGAQFALQLGLPLGQNGTEPPKENWKMLDRNNSVVFTTPLKFDTWQNWAVTLDVPQNTMQVFFSEGNEALKAVTKVLPNNNAGGGALQIGMLKKPTETKTVANDGFQESNLNEGQILGGIFVENSANGCISL
ncbi:hypothetical protein COL154_006143 [Colletotrichum chrysophilum]|uniref:Glycoside hydrolase 131 catalytic N-terminal domain-containing protein n=1 Tax=Colletotrichum chrysophilum TaxID=1836956 RepID=A0AAD9ESA4_9PEZI|nr:hypothetical protein KNSL1_012972 [Colletotrichum chrysophilum]KAJ0362475.1 hypothetical protein COL154_006143 [Colletotrichum chrysophilum]KAK1854821.1 hypothetical protein CCHR01_02501 [Colletotrichum chrysophilum]